MEKARFDVNLTLAETGFENNKPRPHDAITGEAENNYLIKDL